MSDTSADLARLGRALSDTTRSEVLCALMDGRAHTGSELARHVGVAASTMSEHLGKLIDADLVVVEAQGRHRYFRLSGPEVAGLLEAVGATARSVPAPNVPAGLTYARSCYDHLAGALAVNVFDQMLSAGHLSEGSGGLGVSESGMDLFGRLGVDESALRGSRRPLARACLDWTQRRHHLAGSAGKALFEALLGLGWVRRGRAPRSIEVSAEGRRRISEMFR